MAKVKLKNESFLCYQSGEIFPHWIPDFFSGCKIHGINDLDLSKYSAKEFIDYTIPKLPGILSHFKAILPIQEEKNFTDQAYYNGIYLEFDSKVPEKTYFITAKSLD